MIVITTITGIDAAPSEVTIIGAIPVTRIVPGEPDHERAPPVGRLRQAGSLVDEFVVISGASTSGHVPS